MHVRFSNRSVLTQLRHSQTAFGQLNLRRRSRQRHPGCFERPLEEPAEFVRHFA